MWETWKEMFQFLQGYYENGFILLCLYLASLLTILLLGGKKLRKCIGWPVLVLTIVVFNPVFYQYVWLKCFDYGYWRVFWLFPVVLVISVAVIMWIERFKQQKKQTIFLLIILLLLCCNGKNMFYKYMFYMDTENAYKLPQEAIDVADALLELDTEPRVVMCSELYSYVRQYSTDIKMMYGRNIEGYIDGGRDKDRELNMNVVYEDITDWSRVAELMREENCRYLVVSQNKKYLEEDMRQYSFILIKQVDGYNIIKLD